MSRRRNWKRSSSRAARRRRTQRLRAAAERVVAARQALRREESLPEVRHRHRRRTDRCRVGGPATGTTGERRESAARRIQAHRPEPASKGGRSQEDHGRTGAASRRRKSVRDCLLVAPTSGVVLRVQTSRGESIVPGGLQPPIIFRPDGPLVVRAELEQEFLGRVKPAMKATIRDDARADSPDLDRRGDPRRQLGGPASDRCCWNRAW